MKFFPRLSQGQRAVRAGRACHTDPRSPSAATQRLDGPGLGERTKAVPSPVHTGPSSSLAPGAAPGPCPSPFCCAIWQDTNRADNRQPRGKGLLTVFKIESMEVQAPTRFPRASSPGRHPRVTHFPGGGSQRERWAGVASQVPPNSRGLDPRKVSL